MRWLLFVLAVLCACTQAQTIHLEKRVKTVNAKKNADGSCYAHTMASGETCEFLLEKFTNIKTLDNLYAWNKNTFNWNGCNNGHPWAGDKVCVSDGTPPRPPVNKDAVCGPQAPGALFNAECPLNACCSQYGYCGTTSEYCDKTDSPTGAPGTAGCISNCGYGKIHTNPASTFKNIGYWLDVSGAMALDPTTLDDGSYTAIHYAFVPIKSDMTIDDSQFKISKFLSLKKTKKIASFGGWEFSTSPSTYQIFRNGVQAANRDKLATNLVNFLIKYNLDGIDLDWEYPGAQDIPGIPSDDPNNGQNYLELVKSIKSKLPSGKTLSVALPNTYYYLSNFPVKTMQDYVNYYIFMTYDYPGATQNTLFCHTDKNQVVQSLEMLDKAGVKMWKTYGGLANYGHTYTLKSTSCSAIGCEGSGPGKAGPVSGEAGTLTDFEINAIAKSSRKNKRWTDNTSMCDVMVYDNNNWVAWPKAGQREAMREFFRGAGLGGSSLWLTNYSR